MENLKIVSIVHKLPAIFKRGNRNVRKLPHLCPFPLQPQSKCVISRTMPYCNIWDFLIG